MGLVGLGWSRLLLQWDGAVALVVIAVVADVCSPS